MSVIENPVILNLALEESNLQIGVIQNFIQTNTPIPGFENQPIYFGSNVVGYYSVYAINMPQNLPSDVEIYVVKGYILIAQVVEVPSGSAGINVSPLALPQPYITQNFLSFQTAPTGTSNNGELVFDIVDGQSVQFYMPTAPTFGALITIGF